MHRIAPFSVLLFEHRRSSRCFIDLSAHCGLQINSTVHQICRRMQHRMVLIQHCWIRTFCVYRQIHLSAFRTYFLHSNLALNSVNSFDDAESTNFVEKSSRTSEMLGALSCLQATKDENYLDANLMTEASDEAARRWKRPQEVDLKKGVFKKVVKEAANEGLFSNGSDHSADRIGIFEFHLSFSLLSLSIV